MDIAAIIPAYNEEKTIGAVLSALKETSLINQIMVVSDGSEDQTVNTVKLYKDVQVIELLENRGKGGAIKAGFDCCQAEVILILDADLVGLTKGHIEALLKPVIEGEALMSIGKFDKGRVATDLAHKMAIFLSGQRAIKRELLENISDLDFSRFRFEIALHQYVEENNIATVVVQLSGLSHVMKEEKLGLYKGLQARLKMYEDIVKYAVRVEDKPK